MSLAMSMRSAMQRTLVQRGPAIGQRRSLAFVTVGDQSGFDKLESAGGKKIFYFTATWCPPCRMIAPIFEKLAKEHQGVDFCKVDVDLMPEAAGKYKVRVRHV